MGRFRRTPDPERDLAKAIATRGVRTTATAESVRPTGQTREGVAAELELRLRFDDEAGNPVTAVVRQFMNDVTRTGLADGEPASISYDRDDPQRVVVWGSPKYVIIDGVAVPSAGVNAPPAS
jgi:hypothetical protein